MKIWKVILAVMVIFGAGVVTGAMVTRARSPEAAPVRTASKGPPLPGPWRQPRMEFVQKVRNQLNLTADQSAQVDRIMQESHDRMLRLWEPIAPHAREETRIVREEIQGILTPEQKTKFEEICKPRRRPENHPRENQEKRLDHREKQKPAEPTNTSEKL